MSTPRSLSRTIAAAGLAAALVVTSACSDDGDDDVATDAAPSSVATEGTTGDTAGTVDELAVEDVWIRESPMVTGSSAGYAVITSPVDDELVEVRVDPSIAGTVELHETVAADDDHTDDTAAHDEDAAGVDEGDDHATADDGDHGTHDDHGHGHGAMTMRQVESIPLPAGTAVTLEPGGLHLMFLEVATQLEEGRTVELTFVFAEAGEVTVEAEVRRS